MAFKITDCPAQKVVDVAGVIFAVGRIQPEYEITWSPRPPPPKYRSFCATPIVQTKPVRSNKTTLFMVELILVGKSLG